MIDWQHIDTVLLDMDGTLLDLYFDNHFWLEHLPAQYAKTHNLTLEQAKAFLYDEFTAHQGTLNWYCLDFWTEQLGFNVAALKNDVAHLISPRPNAITFIQNIKASGRRAIMVTNAHRKSLELKLEHTEMERHFDSIISSHDFGLPKEDTLFWDILSQETLYNGRNTLLIDDNILALRAAKQAGIKHTLAILRPDSSKPPVDTEEFVPLDCFSSIMPPPLSRHT